MTELARDLLEELRPRGELGSAMRAQLVAMPDPLGIIQTASHPPLGLLQAHLDVGGPYAEGDHLRSIWEKGDSGILAPAGIYEVKNTFGVAAILNGVIPPGWGRTIGWSSDTGIFDGWTYEHRLLQIVVQHDLGGALPFHAVNYVTSDIFEQYQTGAIWLWREANPSYIALHVEPGLSFDLFYLTTP